MTGNLSRWKCKFQRLDRLWMQTADRQLISENATLRENWSADPGMLKLRIVPSQSLLRIFEPQDQRLILGRRNIPPFPSARGRLEKAGISLTISPVISAEIICSRGN
jgi:hypothetical protein